MKTTKSLGAIALLNMLLLFGCSGKTVVESDLGIKGAPDWVNKGTNILEDRNGRLFHGVGSAPKMGDASLQTSTADNRARAELARILSSYMQVMSEDYLATAGRGDDRVNEQAVSQDIRNLTQVNLAGARIIGRWKDPRKGNIYSLAELDLNQVKNTMAKTREMNPGFREYADRQAENIFDRVAREGR